MFWTTVNQSVWAAAGYSRCRRMIGHTVRHKQTVSCYQRAVISTSCSQWDDGKQPRSIRLSISESLINLLVLGHSNIALRTFETRNFRSLRFPHRSFIPAALGSNETWTVWPRSRFWWQPSLRWVSTGFAAAETRPNVVRLQCPFSVRR